MEKMENHICIIASLAVSLSNFRGELINSFIESGYKVTALIPHRTDDEIIQKIELELGITCHKIYLKPQSINPLSDILTLTDIITKLLRIKPSKLFCYTAKPVIYGLLAAKICKINHCSALISGLGFSFTHPHGIKKFFSKLLSLQYYLALKKANIVIFQNDDDRDLFINYRIIKKEKTAVVNGSGVNLNKYEYSIPQIKPLQFMLAARLTKDKGVYEFANAAIAIKKNHPDVLFNIVGYLDKNPRSITESDLHKLKETGAINFLGKVDDIRIPMRHSCSVFVLPSYREGTPRTVLEAMSMGRPIITADSPGCRETVINDYNGYLVKPMDTNSLILAMMQFISRPSIIENMSRNSRKFATSKYEVSKVNEKMMHLMSEINK